MKNEKQNQQTCRTIRKTHSMRQLRSCTRVRQSHPTAPATVDLPAANHTSPYRPPLFVSATPPVDERSPLAVLRSCVQLCRSGPAKTPTTSSTIPWYTVVALLWRLAKCKLSLMVGVAVEDIKHRNHKRDQRSTAGSPASRSHSRHGLRTASALAVLLPGALLMRVVLITPSYQIEGNGDTMTQAHPEGLYIQMHRKSGGYKIYRENSEKWMQDTALHNPLPHLL